MNLYRGALLLSVFLGGPLINAPAEAASFRGRVTVADGGPAYGAMVTVFDAAKERRETVYTANDGSYAIRVPFAGTLTIRARLAGFADVVATTTIDDNAPQNLDLSLKTFADAEEASDALPASAFNARLPWPDARRDRPPFISQCNYCHQVGNATTRVPRNHNDWVATLDKMEMGLFALLTRSQKAVVADVMTRGFDGKPVSAHHSYGASPALARAKVKEWTVGDGYTFVHDAMVGQDQKVYGTDEGHDILWVLDRATGKIEKHPLPDIDLPRGGRFSGLQLPIGVFTGKHGPHSMAQTRDGRIWMTNSLSSTLMSFDPTTKKFKSYPIGIDTLYPHTIRVDRAGVLWFTILASNQIGRFDPQTESMKVVDLPTDGIVSAVSQMALPTLMRVGTWFPYTAWQLNLSTHKFFGHAVAPFPYGIDVNPLDGSIWYAKLNASKIGRLDPKTFAIKEWATPMKGPRRPRFDVQGILWIPAFDDGGLMRFDPASQTFRSFAIPAVGKGEYETPYALAIADEGTGDIWMSANNSDRILRFSRKSMTFHSYPSPTRVTVLRDFSFAADGSVCSSSSNLPAYAIEGGRATFICIDPEGGARDRQALAGQ